MVEIPGLRTCNEDALRELGRRLRHYKAFPKGANVNFYERIGDDHLYERTFERGVEDFTYACGTGTGSLVTALTLCGEVSGRGVRVDMTGRPSHHRCGIRRGPRGKSLPHRSDEHRLQGRADGRGAGALSAGKESYDL